jgi:hypothetical protein
VRPAWLLHPQHAGLGVRNSLDRGGSPTDRELSAAPGKRGQRDRLDAPGGGGVAHRRELAVSALLMAVDMVWRWRSGGQWRRDLHGKAMGEGQDRRSEEILEENEGERGLSGVTECGCENGGWSSGAVRKMEKEGGTEIYSGGGVAVGLEAWHAWCRAVQQGGGSGTDSRRPAAI